jgi:hypothetical protein
MIRRIRSVSVCGPHSLRVTFNDGKRKRVNLLPLLEGPIFRSLRDPAYFEKVSLDTTAGTIVWPNGADLAPEALFQLPTERVTSRRARSAAAKTPVARARGKRSGASRR